MSSDTRERIHVVPAQQGYFVLYGIVPSEAKEAYSDDTIGRDPVVAWKIHTSSNRRGEEISTSFPVTVGGSENAEPSCYAILYPDGRVIIPQDAEYASLADYIRALERERLEHMAL